MKIYLLAFCLLFTTKVFALQTALTPQTISETAWTQALTQADQTNGNSIVNPNSDVFLILSSTAGTSVVTIAARNGTVIIPGYGPLTKADLSITLTSGQTKIVGPLQSRSWNSSTTGIILSYANYFTASTSVKALRLDPTLR